MPTLPQPPSRVNLFNNSFDRDRKSAPSLGVLCTLQDFRKAMREFRVLLHQWEIHPTLCQKKCSQSTFVPRLLFVNAPTDTVVTRDHNPVTIFSQFTKPNFVGNLGWELITQMDYPVARLDEGIERPRMLDGQAIVYKEFHATSFASKSMASCISRRETANHSATIRKSCSVLNAAASEAVGIPLSTTIGRPKERRGFSTT